MTNFQNSSSEPNNLRISPSNRRRNGTTRPYKARNGWMIATIILGVIVASFVILLAFIGMMVATFSNLEWSKSSNVVEIKDNTILRLDIGSIGETPVNYGISFFNQKAPVPTFYELIDGIKQAANDPRIAGIYYDGGSYITGAMATELHIALSEFKKSGKFIYSYLENADKLDYFVASISDTIFVSDEGMFIFPGFGISTMFFKGLYDKIGLEYEVVQCEDYKTAAEPYKNYRFSDSAKVAYKALLAQKENEFIDIIHKQRGLATEDVINVMNLGLMDSDDMIEHSLADVKASKGQILEFLQAKIATEELTPSKTSEIFSQNTTSTSTNSSQAENKELKILSDFEEENIVSISRYINMLDGTYKDIPPSKTDISISAKDTAQIAIICGEGAITSERIGGWFGNDGGIISSDFVELVEEAENDTCVKGIIIRINSPGGSVVASEEIYQAILRAKRKKPVYASMSNVAASGGYYMAMACDTIVAHPNTITGSIGVVAAIPNISKLLDKLSISYDTISTGNGNAFFLDPQVPAKAADIAQYQNKIYKTYDRFLKKVAKSRKKTAEEIRAVAKGRVWTGEDAYEKGLVDVLGNTQSAIELMKNRINSNNVKIVFYPEREDSYTTLKKLLSDVSYKTIFSNLVLNNNSLEDKYDSMFCRIKYLDILSKIADKEKLLIAMPDIKIE